MKFLIVCALVAVVAAQDCSDDRLKKCNFIESFLISGDLSNIKWPDNDGQVLELCGKLSSGGKCIAQLNQDCTKNAHIKQLLGNVLHSLGKYSGKVCGDAAGRAGYLKRVRSCYSLKPVAAGHTEQHKRYVGLIEKIAAQPKAIRSQGICCALLYAFESGRATDKASCPADVLAYLDSIRKEIFTDAFLQQCGGVTSLATCRAKLPAGLNTDFETVISANPPMPTKNINAIETIFHMGKE